MFQKWKRLRGSIFSLAVSEVRKVRQYVVMVTERGRTFAKVRGFGYSLITQSAITSPRYTRNG